MIAMIKDARALLVMGDSVTTTIQPCRIHRSDLPRRYLPQVSRVSDEDFNFLRKQEGQP